VKKKVASPCPGGKRKNFQLRGKKKKKGRKGALCRRVAWRKRTSHPPSAEGRRNHANGGGGKKKKEKIDPSLGLVRRKIIGSPCGSPPMPMKGWPVALGQEEGGGGRDRPQERQNGLPISAWDR